MDWKSLREEKLAKTASYRPDDSRMGGIWGSIERLGDVWGRFLTLSWWEKGLVIGTGVLFTVFAPVAAFAFMGGDGEDGAVVSVATSTPVVIIYDGPTPTITPQPTSTPKALAPTRTLKPPNREDCDEIRGTNYQSDDERDWYTDNCDEPEPTDTATPIQGPPGNPPPVNPTDTPAPQPSISASQARSLAASWIRSSPAFGELNVSAGSCIASASGDGWRVSCTGDTTGCGAAACDIKISVCVSASGVRQC
jgi:hypothetical protein